MHRNKYKIKFDFWTEIEIINQESDKKYIETETVIEDLNKN